MKYVYLIFSHFMVRKSKVSVFIFSVSIVLLSLYLNNSEEQLDIHKRQTMIPPSLTTDNFCGGQLFFVFRLNTHSSLYCICLPGHPWNAGRENTHDLESQQHQVLGGECEIVIIIRRMKTSCRADLGCSNPSRRQFLETITALEGYLQWSIFSSCSPLSDMIQNKIPLLFAQNLQERTTSFGFQFI